MSIHRGPQNPLQSLLQWLPAVLKILSSLPRLLSPTCHCSPFGPRTPVVQLTQGLYTCCSLSLGCFFHPSLSLTPPCLADLRTSVTTLEKPPQTSPPTSEPSMIPPLKCEFWRCLFFLLLCPPTQHLKQYLVYSRHSINVSQMNIPQTLTHCRGAGLKFVSACLPVLSA